MVIEYQGIAAERGVTRHDIEDHLGLTEPADERPKRGDLLVAGRWRTASRIARSPIRDP
jgi:hypothetical protein